MRVEVGEAGLAGRVGDIGTGEGANEAGTRDFEWTLAVEHRRNVVAGGYNSRRKDRRCIVRPPTFFAARSLVLCSRIYKAKSCPSTTNNVLAYLITFSTDSPPIRIRSCPIQSSYHPTSLS